MTDAVQTEHALTKQYLLAQFFTKYQALMEFVQALEIHPQFKANAIMRLDEGMFWSREAIINMAAPVEAPANQPAEEATKIEEPTPLE